MRKTACPFGQRGARACGGCIAVANRHDRTHGGQCGNLAGHHSLGRQCDHHRHVCGPQRTDDGDGGVVERPDKAFGMGATADHRNMRALDMQPDDPNLPPGCNDGLCGPGQHIGGIGDQRGQDRHRAKPPMRRADTGETGSSWHLVQQDSATAVYLQINEPGADDPLERLDLYAIGNVGPGALLHNPTLGQFDGHAAAQVSAVKQLVGDDPARRGHRAVAAGSKK